MSGQLAHSLPLLFKQEWHIDRVCVFNSDV